MVNKKIFRILFMQQNEVYEIYVRNIYPSDFLGFIEAESFLFNNRSNVLVDLAEDKLKSIFENVKRSFIPINSILRIDEVSKEGQAKILSVNKITNLPNTTKNPY